MFRHVKAVYEYLFLTSHSLPLYGIRKSTRRCRIVRLAKIGKTIRVKMLEHACETIALKYYYQRISDSGATKEPCHESPVDSRLNYPFCW